MNKSTNEPKRYSVMDRNRELGRYDTLKEANAHAADLRGKAGSNVVVQDTKGPDAA